MSDFLADLRQFAFLRHALVAGLLASVACGVVGTFVVTRRITYIAGGIAHCVLGGLGVARYCQVVLGWQWFDPLLGALLAALGAAVVIGLVSLRARENEDTVIGALWAVGMAVGVLFIHQTPGYNEDLMSYLFGNIMMARLEDVRMIAGLDVAILALTGLFYHQFLAVCFDEEFARLRGVPVERYYLLLLALTAMTVVLLVTVVGIVLVVAMLALPAATAGRFTRRLWTMMALATLLGMGLTSGGLAFAYGRDWPAGATIIVLAGAVYLAVLGGEAACGRLARRRPSGGRLPG